MTVTLLGGSRTRDASKDAGGPGFWPDRRHPGGTLEYAVGRQVTPEAMTYVLIAQYGAK